MKRWKYLHILLLAGVCFPNPSFATCPNPAESGGQSAEGAIVYNYDHKVVQFCNGDQWIAMMGQALPDCPLDDTLVMGANGWECSSGVSYASCTLDGVTVPHGESETFYSAEEHANCASISQVRNCDDGNLDGSVSYEYANCGLPGCPNVGDQCDDDSYYIGENGSEKIYATTSTYQVSRTWNNGTYNPPWTVTGVTRTTDGAGNTDDLVNMSDAGAPYEAADYCDGLTAHGHSDWYLPAKDELYLFWNEGSPVAGVVTGQSNWYWSSTEGANDLAWIQRFGDGVQTSYGKHTTQLVRCVRSAA
jgi:hypothetical protein